MSYDIYLKDDEKNVVQFEGKHSIAGGTYALGGSSDAWINVTYNYSKHFRKVFGDEGIRSLYGVTAEKSIPLLEAAIESLGDDVDPDYWKSTEGNAKKSLKGMLELAKMSPLQSIWDGD